MKANRMQGITVRRRITERNKFINSTRAKQKKITTFRETTLDPIQLRLLLNTSVSQFKIVFWPKGSYFFVCVANLQAAGDHASQSFPNFGANINVSILAISANPCSDRYLYNLIKYIMPRFPTSLLHSMSG